MPSTHCPPPSRIAPPVPRYAHLRTQRIPVHPIPEPKRAGHLVASVLRGAVKVVTVAVVAVGLLVLTPEVVRVALYAGGSL